MTFIPVPTKKERIELFNIKKPIYDSLRFLSIIKVYITSPLKGYSMSMETHDWDWVNEKEMVYGIVLRKKLIAGNYKYNGNFGIEMFSFKTFKRRWVYFGDIERKVL